MVSTGNRSPKNQQRSADRRLKYLDREMARHGYHQSGLLEVLFKANGMFGFLPKEILRYIATSLGMAPSRVYAAATFYTQFSLSPHGDTDVRICNGVTCSFNGADRLASTIEHEGNGEHPDMFRGRMRCSGLCHFGPVARVNNTTLLHATPEMVAKALAPSEGATS